LISQHEGNVSSVPGFPGCPETWASGAADGNILAGATAVVAGGIPAIEGATIAVPAAVDSANGAVFWAEAHGVPATAAIGWLLQQTSKGTQPSIFSAAGYWWNHF